MAAGEAPRLARPWVNGEVVPQAGTVVGWTAGQPVLTPYDDCVLIMPTLVHAVPGATLVRFARQQELSVGADVVSSPQPTHPLQR